MMNYDRQGDILKLSSYFVAFEYIVVLLLIVLNRQIKESQRKYLNCGVFMSFVATISILISILANYLNLYNSQFYEDLEVIAFANRELCSEGVLA